MYVYGILLLGMRYHLTDDTLDKTRRTRTSRTLTYRIISDISDRTQAISELSCSVCIDCEFTFRDSGYDEAFAVRVCYVCSAQSLAALTASVVTLCPYLCLYAILREPKQLPALSECFFFVAFVITVVSLIIISFLLFALPYNNPNHFFRTVCCQPTQGSCARLLSLSLQAACVSVCVCE